MVRRRGAREPEPLRLNYDDSFKLQKFSGERITPLTATTPSVAIFGRDNYRLTLLTPSAPSFPIPELPDHPGTPAFRVAIPDKNDKIDEEKEEEEEEEELTGVEAMKRQEALKAARERGMGQKDKEDSDVKEEEDDESERSELQGTDPTEEDSSKEPENAEESSETSTSNQAQPPASVNPEDLVFFADLYWEGTGTRPGEQPWIWPTKERPGPLKTVSINPLHFEYDQYDPRGIPFAHTDLCLTDPGLILFRLDPTMSVPYRVETTTREDLKFAMPIELSHNGRRVALISPPNGHGGWVPASDGDITMFPPGVPNHTTSTESTMQSDHNDLIVRHRRPKGERRRDRQQQPATVPEGDERGSAQQAEQDHQDHQDHQHDIEMHDMDALELVPQEDSDDDDVLMPPKFRPQRRRRHRRSSRATHRPAVDEAEADGDDPALRLDGPPDAGSASGSVFGSLSSVSSYMDAYPTLAPSLLGPDPLDMASPSSTSVSGEASGDPDFFGDDMPLSPEAEAEAAAAAAAAEAEVEAAEAARAAASTSASASGSAAAATATAPAPVAQRRPGTRGRKPKQPITVDIGSPVDGYILKGTSLAQALRTGSAHRMRASTKTKKGLYKCSHCSGKYTTLLTLAEHMDDHSLYRPFLCRERNCPWSIVGFQKRSEWARHCRHQHVDEARFKCPSCGRPFVREDSLKRHYKVIHESPNRKSRKRRRDSTGSEPPVSDISDDASD